MSECYPVEMLKSLGDNGIVSLTKVDFKEVKMFHMLSCFNLKPELTIKEFQCSLTLYKNHLIENNLLQNVGNIGKRNRHPVMDTDESNLEYFFIMTFKDLSQVEKSIEYIYSDSETVASLHQDVFQKLDKYNFICWEDC